MPHFGSHVVNDVFTYSQALQHRRNLQDPLTSVSSPHVKRPELQRLSATESTPTETSLKTWSRQYRAADKEASILTRSKRLPRDGWGSPVQTLHMKQCCLHQCVPVTFCHSDFGHFYIHVLHSSFQTESHSMHTLADQLGHLMHKHWQYDRFPFNMQHRRQGMDGIRRPTGHFLLPQLQKSSFLHLIQPQLHWCLSEAVCSTGLSYKCYWVRPGKIDVVTFREAGCSFRHEADRFSCHQINGKEGMSDSQDTVTETSSLET